ncbi:MAG: O-acetylhomoserine aminocarboxypropyltransferase/cysteine synthase [Alphaproteobacteria bacterium]|nr:O-acetylhomoserine aminocarboxypropyltransferase/cysteine synthase [Alphaproteobacteria bacterium]
MKSLESQVLHAGHSTDAHHNTRAVPIYQNTAYMFRDTNHAAALYNLEELGDIYTRLSNPTTSVLEERLATLEGGIGAVATATGHAALVAIITSLLSAGDHIVASRALYGGSLTLLAHTLPRFGITTTFVDPTDPSAFAAAIRPNTKILFSELIGNPTLALTDLQAVADVAHDAGLPFVVDNTFGTPALSKPFEHGVDIVMHSLTKWISGHGVAMGGIIVDSGNFDWTESDKFPTLTEPTPSYHGIRFADNFGSLAFLIRVRAEALRDFGATLSPTNAFHIIQGLETLPLRMERHVANASALVAYLGQHEAVESVYYPGHGTNESDAQKALAAKYLPNGSGGMVSVVFKGGISAGKTFIESLELFSHLANVGDIRSLVIHPASTTHQQCTPEERAAAGVQDGLVRLSVGCEGIDDLIADVEQALRRTQRAKAA